MIRSLTTIRADVAQATMGRNGRGIVWAVLGTGIAAKHPHFRSMDTLALPGGLEHLDCTRSRYSERQQRSAEGTELKAYGRIVRQPVDVKGFGTEVASVIAGESTDAQGRTVRAVAPEAKIVSVKVLDDAGQGDERSVLAALGAIQCMK